MLPSAAIADEHLRLYENAVTVPGPVTDALAAAARQHHIVIAVGVTERDHSSLATAGASGRSCQHHGQGTCPKLRWTRAAAALSLSA